MKKAVAQHGDVIFYRGDKIPEGAKRIRTYKGFIIEKGEGVNTHTLMEEVEAYIKDGILWFKSDVPFHVNHIEHGIEEIPTGINYKEKEREIDNEEMEARRTED